MTNNSITICNTDREPYYKLSIKKIVGKYSIYFIMTISEDIILYLSIYEIVSMQNYLYSFDNSDTLLEPLTLILSPTNNYIQGHIILVPHTEYAHAMWYEGIELYIRLDDKEFQGYIEIEEIPDLYTLLQNIITERSKQ